MGLWRFECRKLWKNRLVMGLVLGCFFLNALLLIWQTKRYDADSRCFPDSVKAVYEALAAVPEERKIAWLNRELTDTNRIEEEDFISEGVETEALYERRNALNYVLSHVTGVQQYDAYLDGITKQAALLSASSLFSEKDSFSGRNAALIPGQYEHLHGLVLKTENSQGIKLVTESELTDVFLIILILLLSYFFICMEREEGTMAFVRTAKYGGKKLGKTKIAVIFTGSLFGAFILYTGNFLVAGLTYGFGDCGRWIQSVEGYLTSPWKVSVGQYLLFFLAGKLLAAAVFAGVVIWIMLHGKNLLRTSAALICLIAAEYGMYAKIPMHSYLDLLRQCSLFSFLRTERLFLNYETVNLFGYPVSSVVVSLSAQTVLLLLSVFFSVRSYGRVSRGAFGEKKPGTQIRKWTVQRHGHSLFYYEGYKVFFLCGAGFLIVFFLLFQWISCSDARAYFTPDELYYKNYIGKLAGDVTQEKLDFVKEEGLRIQKIEQERMNLLEHPDEMEKSAGEERLRILNQQLSCQTAYEWILAQTRRIGRNGIYLDEVGYRRLLEKEQQVYQLGKLLIVWVLAFYGVFVMEELAGMTTLWSSVPHGRKKVQRRKWALLTFCVIGLCIASDLIFYAYRMKAQGIASLDAAIRFLPGFENWGAVSIGEYLAGLCVLKMLAGIFVCGVTAGVSKKAKNATGVLLAAGSAAGVLYFGIFMVV